MSLYLRYSISTPFNGGYSRSDVMLNEKPKYENMYGSTLFWDKHVWTFAHQDLGLMAETGQSRGVMFPMTLQNWTYEDSNKDLEDFNLIPITCVGNFFGFMMTLRFANKSSMSKSHHLYFSGIFLEIN